LAERRIYTELPGPWGLKMYRYQQGSSLTPAKRAKLQSEQLFRLCLSDLQFGMEQICDREPRGVLVGAGSPASIQGPCATQPRGPQTTATFSNLEDRTFPRGKSGKRRATERV